MGTKGGTLSNFPFKIHQRGHFNSLSSLGGHSLALTGAGVTNKPNEHVFGLWEIARVPEEYKRKHANSTMQAWTTTNSSFLKYNVFASDNELRIQIGTSTKFSDLNPALTQGWTC